jgi:hypothetical protein
MLLSFWNVLFFPKKQILHHQPDLNQPNIALFGSSLRASKLFLNRKDRVIRYIPRCFLIGRFLDLLLEYLLTSGFPNIPDCAHCSLFFSSIFWSWLFFYSECVVIVRSFYKPNCYFLWGILSKFCIDRVQTLVQKWSHEAGHNPACIVDSSRLFRPHDKHQQLWKACLGKRERSQGNARSTTFDHETVQLSIRRQAIVAFSMTTHR